jgi:hypothetical protein
MTNPELFKATRLAPIQLPPLGRAATPRALALAAGGVASNSYQLPFTIQTQAQDQWCWAATAVSVSVFHSAASAWTQCSLVCAEVGDPSCCVDGSTPTCNQPWTLDTALACTGNLRTWASGTMPASDIRSELAASRPICCRIQWNGGGGHFVTISGYQNDGTVEDLTVDDPFFGRSHTDLASFPSAYHIGGNWTHTYYTKP